MEVRVASASETVACERAAMERGATSESLMQRAGAGAADLIFDGFPHAVQSGVLFFTGKGNNGGDGWVVADSLARRGVSCDVISIGTPVSPEAQAARDSAIGSGVTQSATGSEDARVIVDALLGTGSSGRPRGEVALSVDEINLRRSKGATVISLDLPSGLDATTGEYEKSVNADLTISFGTMKRGHVVAREVCGTIAVNDIGLHEADMVGLPLLIDREWVNARVPLIPANAHKGTRKTLSVIGGAPGMAGAPILSGEGALRSGIGLLRIVTAPGNETAVHASLPAAIVAPWPDTPEGIAGIVATSDALAIGPGLGASPQSRELVERLLLAWSGPVVIDADAINAFAGDVLSLSQLLSGRPAVITPHPAELARLIGCATPDVLSSRFDIGIELAAELGTCVLLKGTPTVIFSPSGERFVCASGTAALATGGSGDVLTGMIGTLLAQMCTRDSPCSPAESAACAAFVHGRAAELCGGVRGTTLADILHAMPAAWNESAPARPPGVIARLESFA